MNMHSWCHLHFQDHTHEGMPLQKAWIQPLVNTNTHLFLLYLLLVLGTGGVLCYILRELRRMKDMLSCPSCVPPGGGHAA